MRVKEIVDACSTKTLYGDTFVEDIELKRHVHHAFLNLFPKTDPATLSKETELDAEQVNNLFGYLELEFPESSISRYNSITWGGGMVVALGGLGVVCWAGFHLSIQGLARLNVSRFVNSTLPPAFSKKLLVGIGVSTLGVNCCSALNKRGVYPELIAALKVHVQRV